jgi:hypothetical protein
MLGVPTGLIAAAWFAIRVMRHRTVWQGIRLAALLALLLTLLVLLGIPQRVFGQAVSTPVTIVVRSLDDDQPLPGVVCRLTGQDGGSVEAVTDDQGQIMVALPPGQVILAVLGVTPAGEPLHFPALYDALGGLPVFVQATPTGVTLLAERDGSLHPLALDPAQTNQETGSQDAPTAAVPGPTTDLPTLPVLATTMPTPSIVIPVAMPTVPLLTIAPAPVVLPTVAPIVPAAGAATPPSPVPVRPWRQMLACGAVVLMSMALALWVRHGRQRARSAR